MKIKSKILCTIFLLSIIFSGCGDQNYQISNVLLGSQRNKKTSLIDNPITTFNNKTEIIYGQASFVNPKQDVMAYVQVNWSKIEDDIKNLIDSTTLKAKQSGTMLFETHRPGISWPLGKYIVEFVVEDNIIGSQEFEIKNITELSCGEKENWIKSIETSSTVDSAHNPTNPTTNFSSTAKEIYLTFAATNQMQKNTQLKIQWYYGKNYQNLSTDSATINPNQQTHFTLSKDHNQTFLLSSGNWPTGNYFVQIDLGDDCSKMIQFNIQ